MNTNVQKYQKYMYRMLKTKDMSALGVLNAYQRAIDLLGGEWWAHYLKHIPCKCKPNSDAKNMAKRSQGRFCKFDW